MAEREPKSRRYHLVKLLLLTIYDLHKSGQINEQARSLLKDLVVSFKLYMCIYVYISFFYLVVSDGRILSCVMCLYVMCV